VFIAIAQTIVRPPGCAQQMAGHRFGGTQHSVAVNPLPGPHATVAKQFFMAFDSHTSPTGVEVPCALM
jgi:hypothetical protein